MNWILLLIVVAFVMAFLAWQRSGLVSPADVRKHLAGGALVIDVRSPEEYRGSHLPSAINIPLGELPGRLPQRVKDRQQPLLVHCLSGARSAVARRQLIDLGYANVFNLGSLARAREVLNSKP